jgi:hypothetical protein
MTNETSVIHKVEKNVNQKRIQHQSNKKELAITIMNLKQN